MPIARRPRVGHNRPMRQFDWIRMTQRGVFTRAQALECGMSSNAATRAIKRGDCVRVVGRGYVLKGHPITIDQGAWAAKLSVPSATIWGPSALQLLQPKAALPRLGVIAVTGPPSAAAPKGIVVRRLNLPASEWATALGLPVEKLAPVMSHHLVDGSR